MLCTAPDPQTLKPHRIHGTAGDYVMVVSDHAETVQMAKRKAYSHLKRINIPNSPMWRIDIGDRLRKELPSLQSHGYATGMEFAKAAPKPKEEGEVIGGLKVVYV
jgi:hypothetical protein